jgi:hypothetical protein
MPLDILVFLLVSAAYWRIYIHHCWECCSSER